MSSKIAINVITATITLGLLSACAESNYDPNARYKRIMTEFDLSVNEVKSFKTCQSDMKRMDFKPRSGVTMTKVPPEICACHAPVMAKHFKPGEDYDHFLVVGYVSGTGTNTSLDPNDLIDPAKPRKQFMSLAKSLNNCAAEEAQRNTKKTRERVEELCREGKMDAKRCEKLVADLK